MGRQGFDGLGRRTVRTLGAAAVLPAAFALIACDPGQVSVERETKAGSTTSSTFTVENAAVQLPAIPGRPGAAYFTLRAEQDDELVGITTPAARVELHETRTEGGIARMERIAEPLTVGRGRSVAFVPGGKHAMLYDIDPSVKPGGDISLTFTFRRASPMTVPAQVRAAGDTGHMGH